ncbi:Armadillo-like helical [Phytophthora cactorum]|nr:Armadillo-like helical [Phytophthora cactorum]
MHAPKACGTGVKPPIEIVRVGNADQCKKATTAFARITLDDKAHVEIENEVGILLAVELLRRGANEQLKKRSMPYNVSPKTPNSALLSYVETALRRWLLCYKHFKGYFRHYYFNSNRDNRAWGLTITSAPPATRNWHATTNATMIMGNFACGDENVDTEIASNRGVRLLVKLLREGTSVQKMYSTAALQLVA